jgi:hypothetical protein
VYAVKDANSGRIKIVSTEQVNKLLLEYKKPDTFDENITDIIYGFCRTIIFFITIS